MRRLLIIAAIIGVIAVACDSSESDTGNDTRKEAVQHRETVFNSATARYPDPAPQNFPLRNALVKFTERQDELDHPWYIYVLGNTGNVVGYYVGQTVPINACNFLSSTESVRDDDDGGNLVLTAPSLDGIFYGGSASSGACDAWFFFDAATDALIQIRGVAFFTADQPLRLEADPILVE